MQRINLKKNLIKALLVLMIALVLINCVLTFLNGNIIVENNALRVQTEQVKRITSLLMTDLVHGADLSTRGYALTKNDKLAEPLKLVMGNKDSVYLGLKRQLSAQQYDNAKVDEITVAINDYLALSNEMIDMVRQDSIEQFLKIMNEDRGYDLWLKYKAFYEPLFLYEDALNNEAQNRYLAALTRNRIIVIILALIGIPTLIYIMRRLTNDDKQLSRLLHNLDQQNRKYIFDNGSALNVNDVDGVIENSIQNFKKANVFIANISTGNYAVEWEAIDDVNRSLNEKNLAGNLIRMRDHLNDAKIVNTRREWCTSGLAKLVPLVQNQGDIKKLGDSVVKYIVQYTKSNQGCLFVVPIESNNNDHLKLISCYAWNKNRHINMTIDKREGLVGQCWQEGEPIFLTHVPQNYVQISSGLGDACPRCVYLAPIKMNNVVYGVLELASFHRFEKFEIDFINEACESIASGIFAIKMTAGTDVLLSQCTSQIESLKLEIAALKKNIEVHDEKEVLGTSYFN
ncbi:MAG TPA: GAF domain-containing protein [Cyclobacteriaceae bacterium]